MKKLIVVRHAKSDWGIETLKDIDRHLSERGYEDAYSMCDWYTQHNTSPDLIVSSPATRAISTAFIFARHFGIKESEVRIVEEIYESDVKTLVKVVSQFSDDHNMVMLFGHNPGITNFVNEFNKELLFENVPTCGVVTIELNIGSWKEITQDKEGALGLYKFPKSFK